MLLGSPAKLLGNYPQELNKQSANDSVSNKKRFCSPFFQRLRRVFFLRAQNLQLPKLLARQSHKASESIAKGKAYAAVRLQAECLLLPVNIEPSPGTECLC